MTVAELLTLRNELRRRMSDMACEMRVDREGVIVGDCLDEAVDAVLLILDREIRKVEEKWDER